MNTKRIANVFSVVRRCGLASAVAVAMVASAGAAFAQKNPKEYVKVSVPTSCAEELGKYCTGKKSGARSECLEAKRAKLSAVCNAALDGREVSPLTACAKDIGKYCTDNKKYQTPAGLGECLQANRAKLSAVCAIVADETGLGH